MIKSTPLEDYKVKGIKIYVKREDLAGIPPGPPFAKTRGLLTHLVYQKEQGVEVLGYVETSISMAGWSIAHLASELDLKAIIYCPKYKNGSMPERLGYHYKQWKKFGAEIRFLPAGRAKINYYIARRLFQKEFEESGTFLPLGIPLPETLEEVSKEAKKVDWSFFKTLIVNVGSGTMLAGILKGIPREPHIKIKGISGRECSVVLKKKKILELSGTTSGGFFGKELEIEVVDPGYSYTDSELINCPFPCNPYYDRKAWKWLIDNLGSLETPVLFWNIGA